MDEPEFSESVDDGRDGGAEASYSPATHEPSAPQRHEPQQAYSDAPQSWQREIAERHWRGLPDDLRGYLHTRERDSQGKISQLGQRNSELEGVSTRYQTIDGIFQRHQQYIPEGLEREQAIESLLAANRMLSEPETRQQAIGQLLQAYGVDPVQLLPPQYREQFETAQRELQTTRQADVQRTLDEFTKDKTYYPEIRADVIKEIFEIRKGAPGLDNATVLKLAHDRVVDRTGIKSRLDLEAKAKEFEETTKREAERQKVQRAEDTKRMMAAKRAAGINVKSSPVRAAPKSLDDDLREIARRRYGS